ncbi:MAG TPA: GTP-binding protein [Ilumatobacteraceae bacterium]|nr:GTP-binding protein [Ilumatobacteraceae bacterium]
MGTRQPRSAHDSLHGAPALRIATAGSVDDGKSTLIGRLLHDTKTVFEDQLAALDTASRRYGDGERNLALLTDGLRAEREQGITIDVAHRYFATPRRSFIVADTPGHAQYTRNMVTGASTADVAIVLVDARHGVLEQTRRHAFIASLLGVEAIALAVNKMDLVDWDEGEFDAIAKELIGYVRALPTPVPVLAFPVSALHGDNVVEVSTRTPWYEGPALLDWLETFAVVGSGAAAARLDVQRVIRPHGSDFRGFAGRLAGGRLAVGDSVTVMPSGRTTSVVSVQRFGRDVASAAAGQAITVSLADDIDVARGDVLVAGSANATESVSGHVCWMIDQPLREGARYWFKHGTRVGRAIVEGVEYRHDLHSLEPVAADEIRLNDLALVRLSLSERIVAAPYELSREAGRLILVDEATNTTAGAVMITAAA